MTTRTVIPALALLVVAQLAMPAPAQAAPPSSALRLMVNTHSGPVGTDFFIHFEPVYSWSVCYWGRIPYPCKVISGYRFTLLEYDPAGHFVIRDRGDVEEPVPGDFNLKGDGGLNLHLTDIGGTTPEWVDFTGAGTPLPSVGRGPVQQMP